jgi:hypothetical protein
MASTHYQQIIEKLDKLESDELWRLLADVQNRINTRPKGSILDFAPGQELHERREDWVTKLRAEWDDR